MSLRSPQKRTEVAGLSFSPETLAAAQEAAQKARETVQALQGVNSACAKVKYIGKSTGCGAFCITPARG